MEQQRKKRAPRKDVKKEKKEEEKEAPQPKPTEAEIMARVKEEDEALTQDATEAIKNSTALLEEAEENTALVKEIVNYPDVFEIAGERIEIKHLTPNILVGLNMAIIETHKIRARMAQANALADPLERLDAVGNLYKELMDASLEAMFWIVNPDPFASNPKFTVEWMKENLTITDAGERDPRMGPSVGRKIQLAHQARLETTNFFQGIWDFQIM